MKITGFIWLAYFVDKLEQKHNVESDEVEAVFEHDVLIKRAEKGHRPDEDVYAAYGQTNAGRYLVVFFVYKQDRRALIISARDMTPTERRYYGRQ
ncbi:MAG: BrnT family toxin [Caldilineaceae bacterium]|jgi:uncharacterized DUF497 family protein